MEALAPAIAVPAVFFSFGWVIKLLLEHRARMKVVQLQSELHMKVLDRFSSAQDIATYMDHATGGRFLQLVEQAEAPRAYQKIQSALIAGLVLAAGGTGLLLARGAYLSQEDVQGATVFGSLLASLGVGFIIAALSTFFLSKSWGLINGKKEHP